MRELRAEFRRHSFPSSSQVRFFGPTHSGRGPEIGSRQCFHRTDTRIAQRTRGSAAKILPRPRALQTAARTLSPLCAPPEHLHSRETCYRRCSREALQDRASGLLQPFEYPAPPSVTSRFVHYRRSTEEHSAQRLPEVAGSSSLDRVFPALPTLSGQNRSLPAQGSHCGRSMPRLAAAGKYF